MVRSSSSNVSWSSISLKKGGSLIDDQIIISLTKNILKMCKKNFILFDIKNYLNLKIKEYIKL